MSDNNSLELKRKSRISKIEAALFEIRRSRAAFALLGRTLDAVEKDDLRQIDVSEVKAGLNRINTIERKLIARERDIENEGAKAGQVKY